MTGWPPVEGARSLRIIAHREGKVALNGEDLKFKKNGHSFFPFFNIFSKSFFKRLVLKTLKECYGVVWWMIHGCSVVSSAVWSAYLFLKGCTDCTSYLFLFFCIF